jgi:FMN phosphatase YigB (HAD superfamily)
MRRVFGSKKTMDEFRTSVYDADLMSALDTVGQDPWTHYRAQQALVILRELNKLGVPVGVFSNAPMIWVSRALEVLGLVAEFESGTILGCDSPKMKGHMKPALSSYMLARAALMASPSCSAWTKEERDSCRIVFVDDSLANLVPIVGKRWTAVHMTARHPLPQTSRLVSITGLSGLKDPRLGLFA